MDLPATPWELVDALEKLNLVSEDDLYLHAEEYYDFDYIQGFIPESTTLSRLNELCAVLDVMDEQDRIGFRGLLQSSAFFDCFNLGFDRLMDLALAKDCYHIAADVCSDEQLGRFLCQNGFIEGTDELPEKVFELLNFQKIGKDFRMAKRGAYADGCYVAPDGDIPHREISFEEPYIVPKREHATIRYAGREELVAAIQAKYPPRIKSGARKSDEAEPATDTSASHVKT